MSTSSNGSPRRRLSDGVAAALITAVATVLVALITVFAPVLFRSGSSNPTPILYISPSTNPTQTASAQAQYAYDFEDGTTDGWNITESSGKSTTLDVVADPVRTGNHVLEVVSQLSGNSSYNGIYLHTEAKVYFTQQMPQGFNSPPPYDFFGKQVSCEVYLPQELATGYPAASLIIFVKDSKQRNDSGKPVTINTSTVGRWIHVSLVVGKYEEDKDQGFDSTQVIGLGIRLTVPVQSTLSYGGPFYIDNCILPH